MRYVISLWLNLGYNYIVHAQNFIQIYFQTHSPAKVSFLLLIMLIFNKFIKLNQYFRSIPVTLSHKSEK